MPSPRRVKKSVRKGAKKSVRKGAKKSVRKTKRSYRMDPEQRLEMPALIEAWPRRERDPEKVRKEKVRRLIQDATLGYAISGDDLKFLTADEKQLISSISKMFMCSNH